MKAYNAGKSGVELDTVEGLDAISPAQAEGAYLAGQADAEALANAANVDYNGSEKTTDYTPAAQALYDELTHYDQRDINGLRYSIKQDKTSGKYYGNIKQIPNSAGGIPVENARGTKYSSYSRGFSTREEAVDDLVRVAMNNKFIDDSIIAKEDVNNAADNLDRTGTGRNVAAPETVEEVSDGGAVRTAGAGRQDAGGLLDGVSSEDVRGNAQRGDADPDAAAESGGTSGLAHGYAAPGDDGVRGPGVHQGGRVLSAPGEVADVEASLEAKNRKLAETMEKYGITEDEAWAVHEYKSSESYKVNAKLRDGVELTPVQERMVSLLDSALAKLPKVEGTVYRTLSFDDVFDAQEEYDAFLAQHIEDGFAFYSAYTSTSTKADGHPLADGTKLGVTMEITGSNARNLDGFGNNFESEALFPRDTDFIITKVTVDENGHPYIHMEEVQSNGEQNGVGLHSEERGGTVRGVQEAHPADGDVQSVPGGHSERDQKRKSDLQGSGDQVSEETSEPATTEEQIAEKADLGNQEQPKGSNFVIGAKGQKLPTTPKARYKANADAIKTMRAIMTEGRLATPQEQEILAKYTGWGGLSDVFDEKKTDWAKEFKQLKKLLDESEYKTAKGSILDAYYTEPAIIQGMYNGLAKLGFTGGRLLEPSAGVGRFLGAMPADMLGGVKSWTAVELDKITGNIAKYLYPNADVRVQGFETAKIPDNYMDVVIGNVPFGNFGVADKAYPAAITKSIHNYFIAKSLDKARPGGIVAVITSSGTLDATGDAARSYFMKQADLIGAIRLPNTAFEGTGTNVVSDILVFKKREAGTAYKGESFLDIGYKPWTGPNRWGSYAINEYFIKHPEMVLGVADYGSGQYGRTVVTYNPLDSKVSLQKQIEKAFGRIKVKMDYATRDSL